MPSFPQFFEQDEIFPMSYPLFFSLVAILFVVVLFGRFFNPSTSKRKLVFPPFPPELPIIGHLHKIGWHPHRSLYALAQQFGPLMLLHFGRVPVLVISSADAAREIMKTHDLTFADRPKSSVAQKLLYNCRDVGMASYGEYWRQMKSICVLHLLNSARIQSHRAVREEEVVLAIEKIKKSSSSALPVNLSELFYTLGNDIICRVALGRKHTEGANAKNFKKLMSEFVELLGGVFVGDYIPWLAWISRVNGLNARLDRVAKEFDSFLDGVVEEHMNWYQKRCQGIAGIGAEDQKDFVDILLEIQRDKTVGFDIEIESIKAIILDMFAAGTDTTGTTLEWAMTELLRHPKVMKELQNEIRYVAGEKSDISDDNQGKMLYLKAVIKETLRLHPPLPLLLPRKCTKDVEINGYEIAQGTQVIINAWAIGRDPVHWERPEEFFPERFLNNSTDFRGHHFEFIPFGSGRRICPGMQFAMKTTELVLANLMHRFDWSLPGGANEKDLDMSETFGLSVQRKSPLIAIGKQM